MLLGANSSETLRVELSTYQTRVHQHFILGIGEMGKQLGDSEPRFLCFGDLPQHLSKPVLNTAVVGGRVLLRKDFPETSVQRSDSLSIKVAATKSPSIEESVINILIDPAEVEEIVVETRIERVVGRAITILTDVKSSLKGDGIAALEGIRSFSIVEQPEKTASSD
jgi:hypothetical protein